MQKYLMVELTYQKRLKKLEATICGGTKLKQEYIYSCLLGGTFFAVPYLACGIGALPSAAIGVAAYGAGILLFRDKKKVDISDNFEAEDKLAIKQAKESIIKMQNISKQLESPQLVQNVKSIYITSNKIIETVEKKPEKLKKVRNFLNYYLPVTIKILERYDEIENQKLTTKESKKFMSSVENMIKKIKDAFEEQLSNIYQTEMVDTDAELKVFESMLKADGFLDEIDFNIEKKDKEV